MLTGRFLLQIYIFSRHKQNICRFFFVFAYDLLFKLSKRVRYFFFICIFAMFVGDLQKNLLLSVEKIQWNSISPN